jgi:hypothetical protein
MLVIARFLRQLFCRHKLRWVQNTGRDEAAFYGASKGSHWQCMKCMKEAWFPEPYYQDMVPGAERPRHDSSNDPLD